MTVIQDEEARDLLATFFSRAGYACGFADKIVTLAVQLEDRKSKLEKHVDDMASSCDDFDFEGYDDDFDAINNVLNQLLTVSSFIYRTRNIFEDDQASNYDDRINDFGRAALEYIKLELPFGRIE